MIMFEQIKLKQPCIKSELKLKIDGLIYPMDLSRHRSMFENLLHRSPIDVRLIDQLID